MIKERYKKYAAIIQRAKEEGLHVNDKLSVLMDIESADRKFNIRLDDGFKQIYLILHMIFIELSIILYEISFQQRILKDLSLDLHLKNRNSREIIEWKIIKNKRQT